MGVGVCVCECASMCKVCVNVRAAFCMSRPVVGIVMVCLILKDHFYF